MRGYLAIKSSISIAAAMASGFPDAFFAIHIARLHEHWCDICVRLLLLLFSCWHALPVGVIAHKHGISHEFEHRLLR